MSIGLFIYAIWRLYRASAAGEARFVTSGYRFLFRGTMIPVGVERARGLIFLGLALLGFFLSFRTDPGLYDPSVESSLPSDRAVRRITIGLAFLTDFVVTWRYGVQASQVPRVVDDSEDEDEDEVDEKETSRRQRRKPRARVERALGAPPVLDQSAESSEVSPPPEVARTAVHPRDDS